MRKKTDLLVKDIGETDLISRIKKLIGDTDPDVLVPIGDDAAVVRPESNSLQILTTDILVENIHFRTDTYTPFEIGYKAVVVNVSDVAAMAGLPRFALISLGLDSQTPVDFVEAVYKGMLEASHEYGMTLVGGDVTKSSDLIVNVAVVGYVEPEMLRRRSEARVGDQIAVTGELGGATAGLYLLSNCKKEPKILHSDELKKAHLAPKARIAEARIAAKEGANAIEDISDGLASEIRHICDLSKVGARIRTDLIPIAPGVKEVAQLAKRDAQSFALYGGEDFELVFTTPKSRSGRIRKEIQQKTGTKIAIIGEIVSSKEGISLIWTDGKRTKLTNYGFEHF